MQACVRNFIVQDENAVLLLVDIGVWPFHELIELYPKRAKNIGVFESGTISLAAGLSLSGMVPTVYGISPFIAQRALEQIKLDFAYQMTGGNFIVTGASYDFSTLGYSHYCSEDIATLKMIPGIEILTPGTPAQFKKLWSVCHNNGKPTYFRMTDYSNKNDCDVEFGKATVLKRGKLGTVVCVAETMDIVIGATQDMDVTVLYYTTVVPFDEETLKKEYVGGKIYICTPFYKGSITSNVVQSLHGCQLYIEESGVPVEILRNYGTKAEIDQSIGLDIETIKEKIKRFLQN